MQKHVLGIITDRYPSMTKSERKLADYILTHTEEVQYMSITTLAEECEVSEATVSRFAQKLGLDGYNQIKLALAKASTPANVNPDWKPGAITEQDSIREAAQKLCNYDHVAIQETLELLDERAISRAVQYFLSAPRVFCFGQGGSMVMAMEAWARFSVAAPQFVAIEDSHMQAMAASLCALNDVIWFFSYSGATRDVMDLLQTARDCGARIVLVTHYAKCPAAMLADVVLLCGSRESPMQSGSIAAKMGQLFVIDVLFNEYCRQNPQYTGKNREATAQAIAKKLL